MKVSVASARAELDAAPPASFVRTRDALAAKLRAAGHTREAAEIARRRRPSPVLWIVNRLARTEAAAVGELVEAADLLRRAYLRDPRAIPESTTPHRAAPERVIERAAKML